MTQYEIGTKFLKYGRPERPRTIMGYVYYAEDLWYVVVSPDGCQKDEHSEDVEQWINKYGVQ